MASTATSVDGSNRCWEMTVTSVPACRWAAMISSVLPTVISAGFSMITCLPASSASMASLPCVPVGVQTMTTSTRSAASASASEANGLAAAIGGQLLGPLAAGVDDRDQLDPVGQLADHLAVVRADDARAHQGQRPARVV